MGYLAALALTFALELPLYWLVLCPLARRLGGQASTARRALTTGVIASAVTHPLAMLVAMPLLRGPLGRPGALALVESAVVVAEWAIVRHRHDDPFVAAVAAGSANLASLAIGLAIVW